MVSMYDAIRTGVVPPHGMGTVVQSKTFRTVNVWKYEQKDKPTMWWVLESIDNGRIENVYPCGSLDEAQECYAGLVNPNKEASELNGTV